MPELIVIAGCNGAGKSVYAPSLLPPHITSFDYDKCYLNHYNSLPDSELREQFAKHYTTKKFEDSVKDAIANKHDFCYETNFDQHPDYWPNEFKKNGYNLNMVFFCLENQDMAKQRVEIRTMAKGHFVKSDVIDYKWKEGYKNLNIHYKLFDSILFIDNSKAHIPSLILQINDGTIEKYQKHIPDYFERRLPDLYKEISTQTRLI